MKISSTKKVVAADLPNWQAGSMSAKMKSQAF